MNRCTTTVTE